MSKEQSLQGLQTRIDGLRALIARRESQANIVDAPHAHARFTTSHIEAAKAELRDVAADFIRLKIDYGEWDPDEVIERMSLPRVPVERPANDADVIAKLKEFLSKVPDTATVQSLKELIT